jgi:GNAT superfamily N-acetyltransferase
MLSFRLAYRRDSRNLSELALRSKAYWGYSDDFLNRCRAELSYSDEDIERKNCICNLAFDLDTLVGFYMLEGIDQNPVVLDALFVDPCFIGQGFGASLLQHAKAVVGQTEAKLLETHSDPNAEGFYHRYGGVTVGYSPSGSIAGRSLPLIRFEV